MVDNRTERFTLRIAPEEVAMLRELAALDGLSAADVVRLLVRREHEARVEAKAERGSRRGRAKR